MILSAGMLTIELAGEMKKNSSGYIKKLKNDFEINQVNSTISQTVVRVQNKVQYYFCLRSIFKCGRNICKTRHSFISALQP
jgi:hypothetical protein